MTMQNKAYLINPWQNTIMIVDFEYGGSYTQIRNLIGTEEAPDPTFSAVDIDDKHSIYIDDEGLFREDQAFFQLKGYPQPLQGKGLVLGIDYDTGESVPPTLSLEDVNALIHFPMVQPVVEPRYEVRSFDSAAEMLEAMGINK